MLADYVHKAGVGWMAPILTLMWVGLALTLERCWFWAGRWRAARRARPLTASLLEAPYAPLARDARGLSDGVAGALAVFSANLLSDAVPIEMAEARARDHARACVTDSRVHLDVLAFIANLAGTLGLLGTVAGVSMSFEHLARSDPRGLALSLSTAMYTTLGGIFLFLATYLAVFVLGRLSDSLEARLDETLTRFGRIVRVQLEAAPVTITAETADAPTRDAS